MKVNTFEMKQQIKRLQQAFPGSECSIEVRVCTWQGTPRFSAYASSADPAVILDCGSITSAVDGLLEANAK